MVDTILHARTNQFRIRSIEELKDDLRKYGINLADEDQHNFEMMVQTTPGDPELVELIAPAGWPILDEDWLLQELSENHLYNQFGFDVAVDDDEDFVLDDNEVPNRDIYDLIAKNLAEGSVAIGVELCYEGLRHLSCAAIAVNKLNQRKTVLSGDINDLAKSLGDSVDLL